MAVQLNTSAVTKANSLVSSGKVQKSSSWNPPSTTEENSYIERNGITAFSNWFLGEDTSIDAENKTRYKYIYTSDFQNVDRAGLVAIRQRAAQQDETSIFNAAGDMIEKIDKKMKATASTVETKFGKETIIKIVSE